MNNQRINWYRTSLDKAVLRELNQRSDLAGFLKCLTWLAVITLTGWFAYWAFKNLSWPFILLAFFIHGTVITFTGPRAAVHELSHGTVFKTKFWNEFFIKLFSFISWTNYVHFRTSHNLHHQYTLHTEHDGEVVLPAVVKFPPLQWLMIFTINPHEIYRWIQQHLYFSFGKLLTDWDRTIFPESDAKNRHALYNWSRIILIGHAVLIGLCIAAGEWILIPIALTPFYCTWLGVMCCSTQHAGLPSDVPDFRKSCRTMYLNPVCAYFYWNMNYHIEHHMYAAVPFFKLPKLHDLIADDCPPPCRSLGESWRELLAIKKRQETEPEYTFDNFKRGIEPV